MNQFFSRHFVLISTICSLMLPVLAVAEQEVSVSPLSEAPVLDGILGDWSGDGQKIALVKAHPGVSVELSELRIWAGHFNGMVYMALRWEDASPDRQHKPYVWDDQQQRYVAGKQREDRLAIQFEMSGDYDTNWLSGNEFTADMWHWKSARSAPVGLAHDKMTIISRSKLTRSFKASTSDGTEIYIRRPSDAGDEIYSSKRYGLRENKQMPKYILNNAASGSIADVKAGSLWQNGYWQLELARKLDTGHKDDVAFAVGKDVRGGIAVFNRSGDDDHVISQNLLFRFMN
jgi:hypothetical protein